MRKPLAFAFIWLATCAMTAPQEVRELMPEAQLSGEATYRAAFFKLYHAALWTEPPAYSPDNRFALSLEYKRGFSAERLANASIVEMARITGQDEDMFEPIRAPLTECFADVERGDRITGVALGPDTAAFYFNGEKRCDLEWPSLRLAFFGIWLSDESRAPEKAAILRGVDG